MSITPLAETITMKAKKTLKKPICFVFTASSTPGQKEGTGTAIKRTHATQGRVDVD